MQTALKLDHPLCEGQKSLFAFHHQIFRQMHSSLWAGVTVRMTGKQNTCGKTLFRAHFCQIPLFSTDFITRLMWRKCLKTLWHNMGRAGSLGSCIMNPTVCCKQLSSCKQVVFLSSQTLCFTLSSSLFRNLDNSTRKKKKRISSQPISSASTSTQLLSLAKNAAASLSFFFILVAPTTLHI